MKKKDFLNELTEIMQLDVLLNGEESLDSFVEWDSMAHLGVMSMFDMEFGITLKTEDLKQVKTINELVMLASNKVTE